MKAAGLFAAAILGCQNSTGPDPVLVRIEPTKTLYFPADTVSATFRNLGPNLLGYSNCHATLQRWEGSDWVVVPPIGFAGLGCPDAARGSLPAGATQESPVGVLSATLTSGTYRYRMEVITDNLMLLPLESRLSAPFLVGEL